MRKYLALVSSLLTGMVVMAIAVLAAPPGVINQFNALCDGSFPKNCAAVDSSGNLQVSVGGGLGVSNTNIVQTGGTNLPGPGVPVTDSSGNDLTNSVQGAGIVTNTGSIATSAGTPADAAWTGSGNCTQIGCTKGVYNLINSNSVTLGQAAPSSSVPSALPLGVSATLQSGATGNAVGSTLNVNGFSSAILTVNCSACSGGTTVTFEGSEDGTNYANINAVRIGSSTIAPSTVVSGLTYWQVPVAGFQLLRAEVSAYSAGTITVTAHAVQTDYAPKTVNPVAASYAIGGFRCTASATTTGVTTCLTARGAGIKIYVTDVECGRSDAGTTAITVTLDDVEDTGSGTVLVLPNGGGGGGNNKQLTVPLVTAANGPLTFQSSGNITTVYCNMRGFVGP